MPKVDWEMVGPELLDALTRLLAFPLAVDPESGESEGDLEIAIGEAADVVDRARLIRRNDES